jgi:hypothetical protein
MKVKPSTLTTIASLFLIVVLVSGSWTTAQALFVIPTFDVTSVTTDTSVTIKTYNFPANDTFRVLMGKIGTRGVGGYQVATVNSGAGGTFTATYNIPAELKGLYQISIRLESPTSGYFSYNWFYNNTSGTIPNTGGTPVPSLPPGVIPTFSITNVVLDTSVDIKTANFPANDTFDVLMGQIGTRGVGGVKVGTWSSGTGGVQTATFNIPASLKGLYQIAIRLQSPVSGYFSYNWFYNNTSGTIPNTGGTPVPSLPPGVFPSFTITAVMKDSTVTVKTANMPANDTFTVRMGAYGTLGVGGTSVGTWSSGTGGAQTATFNIPSGLQGASRIAIRLESATSGYFAYNWFWNNTYP